MLAHGQRLLSWRPCRPSCTFCIRLRGCLHHWFHLLWLFHCSCAGCNVGTPGRAGTGILGTGVIDLDGVELDGWPRWSAAFHAGSAISKRLFLSARPLSWTFTEQCASLAHWQGAGLSVVRWQCAASAT